MIHIRHRMRKLRQVPVFMRILIIVSILQFSYLIYRAIDYANHYPVLIGAYCFKRNPPLDYLENIPIDDEMNIRQCSLKNLDACQRISNQTILFRFNWKAGLASELNNLIRAFTYAIHTRRRFLIDGQYWNYGSLTEFFNISRGYFSPWLPASTYCSQRQFIHLINYPVTMKFVPQHLTVSRDINGAFPTLNLIIRPLEADINRSLEVKRIVAQYFWKTLNNQTRDFIDQYMKKILVENIIYGMHIRRGDKLQGEAKSIPLEKYIAGIEYFMKNESIISKPRVYVASDEDRILDQLRQLRSDWEFVQITRKSPLFNGHRQNVFNSLPMNIKLQLTRILLTEIEILSRVKYLVCTYSSNICRFIQILRLQPPQTVLSLDEQWYPS